MTRHSASYAFLRRFLALVLLALASSSALAQTDDAMQKTLDKRLAELRFDGIAFSDVVDHLRDVSGANITVNWKTIEAAGIEKNAPVTLRLRDIKFANALSVVLRDLGGGNVRLGYAVEDGVINISTAEDLDRNTEINVYDIRDLLADSAEFGRPPVLGDQPARDGDQPAAAQPDERTEQLVNDISNLIKETVDRESWVDNGGKTGQLKFISGQFILTQTKPNHRHVVNILDKLREQKSVQIAVEMRFIRVPATLLQNLDIRKFVDLPADARAANRILKNEEVAQLLKVLAADPKATILAAPRITCFTARRATVAIGEEHRYISGYRQTAADFEAVTSTLTSGLSAETLAIASADREFVTLKFNPRITGFYGLRDKPWPNAPEGKRLMIQDPILAVSELSGVATLMKGETVIISLPGDPGSDMAVLVTASAAAFHATEPRK